jgi:hypothetical protein
VLKSQFEFVQLLGHTIFQVFDLLLPIASEIDGKLWQSQKILKSFLKMHQVEFAIKSFIIAECII